MKTEKIVIMLLIALMLIPSIAMISSATLSTTHEEKQQSSYVGTPVTLKTTDHRSSDLDPSTDQLWVNVTLPDNITVNIAYENFSISSGETKTFTYTYYPQISGDYIVTYDYQNAPDQTGNFTAYLPDITTSATDMLYVNETAEINASISTTRGAYNGTLNIYINGTGESPSLIDTWNIVMDNYQTKEHTVHYIPTKNDKYTITYDFSSNELDRIETFEAFKKPIPITSISPITMWQGNITTISYSVIGNNSYHPDLTVRGKIIRPDGSYYYTVEKTLVIPSSDTMTDTITWDIKQIVMGHYGVCFEELSHRVNAKTDGFNVTVNPNEIKNHPPIAFASVNIPVIMEGSAVKFEADGSDEDGIVVNYTWKFGDGTISYEKNPSHTYEHAGTYDATLIVTDNDGARGYNNISITVYGQPPAPRTIYLGMPTPYLGVIFLVIGGIFLAFFIDAKSSVALLRINFLTDYGDFFGVIFIMLFIEEYATNGLIQRVLGSILGF